MTRISREVQALFKTSRHTPSPPTKSLDFEGFDSSRLLILRGGILMSVEFYRESPGKFDSRTLNREIINWWTGRTERPGAERIPLGDHRLKFERCRED